MESEAKGKERKSKENGAGTDLGLRFDSGKKAAAVVDIRKGKKRSLPSDVRGQGNERSAKKGRLSKGVKAGKEGDSKNDTPASASKKVVSLDRSLAKSFQTAALWYEAVATAAANLKAKASKDVSTAEGDEFSENKRKEAEQMEKAVADHEKWRSKDSDTRWLTTARRSGTSSDKVAAMTVMLQDNRVKCIANEVSGEGRHSFF